MVPDVFQIFIKGHGVFANPVSEKSPPRLRYLFEAAPIARLVEVAGGLSFAQVGSALDITISEYEQKTQLCVGSSEEVQRFIQFLNL